MKHDNTKLPSFAHSDTQSAFTIVELLVVIVVIAILATITIVSYTNITAQANTSSVKSTLNQAIKGLEAYKEGTSTTETYPSATAFSTLNIAKNSTNISYTYYPSDTSTTPSSYCLEGATNNTIFSISSTNEAVVNKPCTENSLVGWWKLNGDATDSSGNNNNGTVYGALAAAGEDGTANGAYSFNGSSDYISLGQLYPTNWYSDITIGAWVYISSSSDWNSDGSIGIVGKGRYEGSIGLFKSQATNYILAGIRPVTYYSTSGSITTDSWHYLVSIYNCSTKKLYLYIDNSLKGYVSVTSIGSIPPSSSSWKIGGDSLLGGNNGNYFYGSVDDVRIYNRTLSASEIQTLYSAGAQ